ncbi:MAG: hypothetical protein QOI13_3221 [Paraburkholderia sp.]|nr:hypothetical protein [Paraburkholderia sp.]
MPTRYRKWETVSGDSRGCSSRTRLDADLRLVSGSRSRTRAPGGPMHRVGSGHEPDSSRRRGFRRWPRCTRPDGATAFSFRTFMCAYFTLTRTLALEWFCLNPRRHRSIGWARPRLRRTFFACAQPPTDRHAQAVSNPSRETPGAEPSRAGLFCPSTVWLRFNYTPRPGPKLPATNRVTESISA